MKITECQQERMCFRLCRKAVRLTIRKINIHNELLYLFIVLRGFTRSFDVRSKSQSRQHLSGRATGHWPTGADGFASLQNQPIQLQERALRGSSLQEDPRTAHFLPLDLYLLGLWVLMSLIRSLLRQKLCNWKCSRFWQFRGHFLRKTYRKIYLVLLVHFWEEKERASYEKLHFRVRPCFDSGAKPIPTVGHS